MRSRLHKSGQIVGTLSYMAPEQAEGKTREIGPPTDVHALGAILYEMLTGRPPYLGTTWLEVLQQVKLHEPVPPRQLQPKIPADLETICLKCLNKDASRRYASAEALADDLRRFQAGEPIQARPVSNAERFWRWCRRNPVVSGLATGLIVLFLVAFGIVTDQMLKARWERDQKEMAREAEKQQKLAAQKAEQGERDQKLLAQQAEQKERIAREAADDRAEKLERSNYLNQFLAALGAWQENDIMGAETKLDECNPQLRSFEWYYLRRLCRMRRQVFPGLDKGCRLAVFSPDSTLLAISDKEQVALLDVRTGKHRPAIGPFMYPISALCFTPDNKYLAVATADQILRLWDVHTGKEVRAFRKLSGYAFALAFRAEGKEMVSATAKGSKVGAILNVSVVLQTWNTETGELLQEVKAGEKANQPQGAFSRDGKYFAWTSSFMPLLDSNRVHPPLE